ncbi:MAG: hypothetical protein OEY23_25510 [Acidimicrobiia bacterium]|nr:hypothetical protein [Acidimicrobiia bacterium]
MMRRVRWMVMGAAAGWAGQNWARRQVRRLTQSLAPKPLGRAAAARVGGRLDDARREAQRARAETEQRLRARLTRGEAAAAVPGAPLDPVAANGELPSRE